MKNDDCENKNMFFNNHDKELAVLRFAIENTPVPISISDSAHRHLYQNECFSNLFGVDINELKTHSLESFFADPKDYARILTTLKNSAAWIGEVNMLPQSGSRFPVMLEVKAIGNENVNHIAFLWVYTDITEQKAIKKELSYRNEYLSTLHSISLGMFRRLNVSDLLNAIMDRASKITGIPNGFLHLFDPEQRVLEIRATCGNLSDKRGLKIEPGQGLAGKVFESGEPMIIDNYQAWPDRLEDVAFEDIFSIIGVPLISGSKITGVIGLSHDREDQIIDPDIVAILEEFAAIAQIAIDNARLFDSQHQEFEKRIALEKERKEMEVRLHQSQRMESIGTLAGGIAHDFNNILSSIMGFTQIAQNSVEKGSVLEEDLNEIYTASLRAKDLVQQILTFARQSEEHVNPIKVSIIAKEVLKFIRSSIPSTITIKQDIKCAAKVLASPTQVYQMFLNLFTNAAQAMQKNGGKLTLDMAQETLCEDKGSIRQGNYVRILISDTGQGIAQKHLHNIFEPYFTTKKTGEGTGLGLSVVHGAVKSMGGDIFVTSREGRGTTFTIYLPVAEEKVSGSGYDDLEDDTPMGRQEHILFVDDEISIVKVGKRMLEALNYKVTALSSSQEALETFLADPSKIDAVVTDMTMPDLTGDKLALKIKQVRPDLPIILCTGFSQYLFDKKLAEIGIDHFCSKPILKAEIATALRSVLETSQE